MTATHSRKVAVLLRQAAEADRERARFLNQVAEGEIQLSPAQREDLLAAERWIRDYLGRLTDNGLLPKMRVVSTDDHGAGTNDKLPRRLEDAYALLCHNAYGSDPAISTGDPSVIRGLGTVRGRTSTNQPEDQVPGARQRGKRAGASRRNVIRDRRSYELKLRADRRMRQLAKEIEEHLEGGDRGQSVNTCSRCGRIGEDGWAYCPHCGHEMKVTDREAG